MIGWKSRMAGVAVVVLALAGIPVSQAEGGGAHPAAGVGSCTIKNWNARPGHQQPRGAAGQPSRHQHPGGSWRGACGDRNVAALVRRFGLLAHRGDWHPPCRVGGPDATSAGQRCMRWIELKNSAYLVHATCEIRTDCAQRMQVGAELQQMTPEDGAPLIE